MLNLLKGDCFEQMATIEPGSVSLVLTDPPYGNMGGLGRGVVEAAGKYKRFREETTEWDTALDPERLKREVARVLRENGTAILFSQEPYTGRLSTLPGGPLPFSYRMAWIKDHFGNSLSAKKAPVSLIEDVLVFFKPLNNWDTENRHPLRAYARAVLQHIGKPRQAVLKEMGSGSASHFFTTETEQFAICTARTYQDLDARYNLQAMPGYLTHDQMAEIDRPFRRELLEHKQRKAPKVFNLPEGKRSTSNVLQFPKDKDGFHPTQKPVALLRHLIELYSNPGDTVLDFTMGSGSTGVAALACGRRFIGIEKDDGYFETAQRRIYAAAPHV